MPINTDEEATQKPAAADTTSRRRLDPLTHPRIDNRRTNRASTGNIETPKNQGEYSRTLSKYPADALTRTDAIREKPAEATSPNSNAFTNTDQPERRALILTHPNGPARPPCVRLEETGVAVTHLNLADHT
jgi:hypothetical protein